MNWWNITARRRQVCLLLMTMLLTLMFLTPRAGAQSLPVSGSAEEMWVVLPEADQKLTVLHRKSVDAPGHFWRVVSMPGVLAAGGMTAGDHRLWLIYSNHTVQALEVIPDPYLPQARYSQAQFHRQIPDGVKVRSVAGTSKSLWALVQVENAITLKQLDTPATTQPQSTTQPATQPAAANATQPAEPVVEKLAKPVDRLIRLERGRWLSVPLPKDMGPVDHAWLVMGDPGQTYPVLVVERANADSGRVVVYRHIDEQWTSRAYQAQTSGDVAFALIQQQLVLARRAMEEQTLRVTLNLLRPERDAAVEIGSLSLDLPATASWGLAANGLLATLIARQGQDTPVFTSMTLQGQLAEEPAPIQIETPPAFVQDPGHMLLVGVVAISIFLMFVIWRRDPSQIEVALPEGIVIADLGRRVMAGAIDLAPCVLAGMMIDGESLMETLRHWPGRSGSWSAMLPGLIAIGLFVLHTCLSELFTGRTLGKALLGLQVVSTDGQPPNIWQVIARNFLKSFDLIACYILPILALVGKHHQRLGDLVGRTLVVMSSAQRREEEDDAQ